MNAALAVMAAGMVTAAGYNAPATLAALRAGVSGVRAGTWADDDSGEPLRCARVSLPQRWTGVDLLADLLAPAIQECLAVLPAEERAGTPLLVGTSHPQRPGRPPQLDELLLPKLHARLGMAGHAASRTFASGQTGGMHALVEAHRLIAGGAARQAVVAGVDSLLDRATLSAYAERRRLLSSANFNGFLAGEAASAVLIGPAAQPYAGIRIDGWGLAVEPATIEDTRPLQGTGLLQAVRAALRAAGANMAEVAFRVTDLSGEHYKFKEAMFVPMRLDHAARDEPLELWHPIEYLGEIGAAILPVILAQAGHAMRHGYAPGYTALCHVGNDAGERAALVVRASRTVEAAA